jgi:hypothetical protein
MVERVYALPVGARYGGWVKAVFALVSKEA